MGNAIEEKDMIHEIKRLSKEMDSTTMMYRHFKTEVAKILGIDPGMFTEQKALEKEILTTLQMIVS